MKFIILAMTLAFGATIHAQTINEIALDPTNTATAQTSADTSAPKSTKTDISYSDSIALGFVEGFTEYLPVSSTGHLVLANAFLELDSDAPLLDRDNNPILNKKFEPLTLKAAADAYAIVIQLGAIAAVAIIYWDCLLKMLFGLLGRNPEGLRLLRNLVIAFMPAAVVGLLIHDFIETFLFGVVPVIAALFFGALLMIWVQKKYAPRRFSTAITPRMEDMSMRSALLIGILQCVAMWPGTSRSMMTIVGGYIAGLKPSDSARFSFLLGLMTLSAASLFKIVKDGDAVLRAISVGPLLLGIAIAFVSAAVSVKWLVGFLNRRGLAPFAYYRIILAVALCALVYFNLL